MMKNAKITTGFLIGAVLTGIVASLCCVGPLVLLLLGVAGAWASNLTSLAFLRPFTIPLTLVLLGIAFWKLYITPRSCSVDKPCVEPKVLRIQRILFWIIAVLLIGLLTFPWYAPLFYVNG